jgi:hypothetical protein
LLLGVKVNLEVDRKALPEVSLEVEVEVGCTLPIFLDSEGSVLRVKVKVMLFWYCNLYENWYTLLFLGVKVNLKVDRKALPVGSLEVEVEVCCTLPICLDSEGSVLRVKVKVM